jgi:hypothetical protein
MSGEASYICHQKISPWIDIFDVGNLYIIIVDLFRSWRYEDSFSYAVSK